MDDIQSLDELNFIQLSRITSDVLTGDVPLGFTVNLMAVNPNPTPASLHKMEYIAFIDDLQIATGTLTERIEIAASGGTAVIPLGVTANLMDVFKTESLQVLINFVLNLMGSGDQPTRISLKIKPTISIAGKDISSPVYITVKTAITSGK